MALQSARILPLTEALTWQYARIPGSVLTVVRLNEPVDVESYAARDFELQYRDLIVAGALAEVALHVGDVWGWSLDRIRLPSIPRSELSDAVVDAPETLAFPGAVSHVKPSSIPKDEVDADRDLYGRDLILWEVLARVAAVLEEPPIASLRNGLVLSEAWSLAEGSSETSAVNGTLPLSVDLFKLSDQNLAERDNLLSAYAARAYAALVDIYSRATRLLVRVDDADLNRDPDLYVLYSDDAAQRVWIATPGLPGRSRIVFDKMTRCITWTSNYYTNLGVGNDDLSQSFGSVNALEVKARSPSREDVEYFRQKTSQLKLGRFREVPVYFQASASLDVVSSSAAFLGPDDVMLSSDGSSVEFEPGLVTFSPGVYRFGFLYETSRLVRLFGAFSTGSWPIVSATAATITGPGEMSWAIKLEAGSYTLRLNFADLLAATPNFEVDISYQGSTSMAVYSGLLLYGRIGGIYVRSPTYIFQADGASAVLTLRRTDTNAGQLTVDMVEILPLSADALNFHVTVFNGTNESPYQLAGVPGAYGCAYFDFSAAAEDNVTFRLDTLDVGALYIKSYDLKKIELQRETPDTSGYLSWKRGWLERAICSVRQSWFDVTALGTFDFLKDGIWTADSTENWMNTIEAAEPRLRQAFRVGRPSDVGQPALTPDGLDLDEVGTVTLVATADVRPVLQALQPWMIRVGVYVAVEDFWPTYYVSNVAGIAADFDAVGVVETTPPTLSVYNEDGTEEIVGDLDFGTVTIGDYLDVVLRLVNVGGGTLELGTVEFVSGSNFELVSGPATTSLQANEFTFITIRFTPAIPD